MRVRSLECGWISGETRTFLEGQDGTIRMPVAAFLIEHPKGTLVFDTGMHPELETTKARLKRTERLVAIEQNDGYTVTGQLAAAGVAVDDVDIAVLSHLHFDHAGGLGQLPSARLLVQRDEWAAAFEGNMVDAGVFNPDDFDLGHDRQEVDGEHDVFGDGSVRVIPTPGHTAGHQSLLLNGDTLLCGDACYCQLALDLDALPPFGHDRDRHRDVFKWLRDEQAAGRRLVFSHDPDQWTGPGAFL